MNKISNKKNYLLTLFSSFGSQLFAIIISIISVPISLKYWGETRYGLFALINSVIVYLSISNLGLNSAASVLMAKSNNFKEKIEILKRSFLMILLSIMVFTIGFIFLNKISNRWIYLLGDIPKKYFNETYNSMYIMVLFFFINTLFSLVDSIFNGFYKVYIQKNFEIMIKFFSFGALLLTIYVKGKLYHFVFFIGMVKLIFSIIKIIYSYYYIYKTKRLEVKEYKDKKESSYKNIFVTGIRFFFIGLASMVVWNTDNLVISHFINVKSVTPYSITFKIFKILFQIIFIFNSAMLPLLGKEFGNNNWKWINKTYERLLKIMAILGGFFWIGGNLFLKDFIHLWTGEGGYAGLIAVFALGGYAYLLSMVNLNSGVANSFNYTKGVVWIGWLEAILNFSFSLILLRFFGLGGVAIGTFLGSLFGPTLALPIILVKYSKGKIDYDLKFILNHFIKILFPMLILSLAIQVLVNNLVSKIILGVLLLIVYAILSFKMFPREIKIFIREEIAMITKKVGVKK